MERSRLIVLSAVALSVLLSGTASPSQANTAAQEGAVGVLYDVRIVPASCLLGDECVIEQPSHLVEYYAADWCEPCDAVADVLTNLTSEDAFVLQHHGSPADQTFLSASKLRFDHEFRLLFVPSLVVDGVDLLTGTRQAMDLGTVLNASSPFTQDLNSLSVNGTNLTWETTPNGTVRAWYVEPTPHESQERIHPTLAQSMLETNASVGRLEMNASELNASGTVVVMLEHPGVRTLNVASLAPTGPMSLSENDAEASNNAEGRGNGWWVLAATVALAGMLAPAVLMHRSLMGQDGTKQPASSLENE